MITEHVYLARDNENVLTIIDGDAPADLSNVTRMVLKFKGSDVVVDSALTAEMINWSSGTITLRLGELNIEPSRYFGTLIAYDPLHDDGQVLFHADVGDVLFWFLTS